VNQSSFTAQDSIPATSIWLERGTDGPNPFSVLFGERDELKAIAETIVIPNHGFESDFGSGGHVKAQFNFIPGIERFGYDCGHTALADLHAYTGFSVSVV